MRRSERNEIFEGVIYSETSILLLCIWVSRGEQTSVPEKTGSGQPQEDGAIHKAKIDYIVYNCEPRLILVSVRRYI